MALVCDVKSSPSETTGNNDDKDEHVENPDLEDGEIEDDDEDEAPQPEPDKLPEKTEQTQPATVAQDAFNKQGEVHRKRRHSTERKSEKHLTEAEKSVRYLHKLERAERERRERIRKEQLEKNNDDWAGNVEKAIASVLKKEQTGPSLSGGEEEEEDKKRGRKRKKKARDRSKKHKRTDSPGKEEVDEDEMLLVRGGSPENKILKESSPADNDSYNSYDSEYDSDYDHYGNRKRKFDREHKRRNRDGSKRDRKNFKEKQRDKVQREPPRQQIEDGKSICMFYMQGKCHKADECPYSHDALPPLKMELCKFYLMDCCAKREKCLYMHSEFPCKFYHTGLKCFAKDNCKFAHGKPLTDNLKQILLKHLETAPKEILGDFPRLSREGAQNLVNQTQKMLETQYGIKNGTQSQPEKSAIPSLFDITVPIPPELLNQQQQQQMHQQQQSTNNDGQDELKPEVKKSEKKVRQTRWNPPQDSVPIINPYVTPVFNTLTAQDQQKLQEYQRNFQLKGFYSEQDQDMRINTNGDVDMRSIPLLQNKTDMSQIKPSEITEASTKMDVDIRTLPPEIPNITPTSLFKTENISDTIKNEPDVTSDSSINNDTNLTIDEKLDNLNDLPHLPKKQRELYLRIQAQQKENLLENQNQDDDDNGMKDENWYSSDEDNDPSNKMVIHLEDEKDEVAPEPARIFSPPTIKPVEVIDKLGDLSKIDISAEVTKLLSSIKSAQNVTTASSTTTTSVTELKNPRDPRQAHSISSESSVNDPRTKSGRVDRKESGTSIYEQGIINPDHKVSIYEQGTLTRTGKDVDLRNLESLPKDLDMRSVSPFGDTDLRPGGRQDVDLRQLSLPFKAIQNYTPATEIDASIGSHSPIPWRVHIVDIPRPDYSGLKLNAQDSQVNSDPRLRKIFRVPSVDEKDSPASPSNQPQSSPPKVTRQDPRRRNAPKSEEPTRDTSNMTYAQQLQLLQNSAFYQSLTTNQKMMLNQEIASKSDQNHPHDPILTGILANIGLISSVNQNNGCATNILANVNSLVPNLNQINPINVTPNVGQVLGQAISGLLPLGGNVPNPALLNQQNIGPGIGGPGLLGAAPGVPFLPNLAQNDFPMNLDPRNGGLLGAAPFPNFPNDQNFGQFNDDYYDGNDGGNFGGNFNNRNDRNFRNDRNQPNNNRRGRSWNNRHNSNNNRNYNNRNNNNRNNNRSNRSYTPP